ncbi:MAG TPA: hypothetical protein VEG64_05135 [Candidatus Sulfotelmatobacter sp.]|nr:hypothetical protein [Candidatus Sulfotelmatobacter sp.]
MEEPAEDFPFDGAAKTESCRVCLPLAHFGHVMACFWLITSRSYRSPQSLQMYS